MARAGASCAAAALVVLGTAPLAQAQSVANGQTYFTNNCTSGCHSGGPTSPYTAPRNAGNASAVITYAANQGMVTPPSATALADLAAYLNTFVSNPFPVSAVNVAFQGSTSFATQIVFPTAWGTLTGMQHTNPGTTLGTVTFTGSSVNYTAPACTVGADSLNYRGTGNATTSTRTANINISNPASGPTISTGATLPAGQTSVSYSTSLAATCSSLVTFSHVGGTLPPGLSISSGGTISGTPTSLAGSPYNFTIRATYVGGAFTDKAFTISISIGPPNITSGTTAASGSVGVVYSGYTITATNSPTSFSATGLPPGLTVDTTTGVISGTPTDASGSPYTANVVATNSNTSDNQNVTFNIVPAINSAATANGQTGVPFTYSITEGPGPAFTTHAALDSLPPGLTLTAATGVISGTPTVVGGPTNVRLTGSNAFGTSAQFTLAITIGLGPPVITSSATAANSSVGVAYSGYTITATNSPTIFGASNLPPGLTVNPTTGAITGTPTSAAGSPYTATVTASNGVPPDASQNVTFNVVPAINSAATASGQTGVAFTYQITAAPGPAFASYAALDPLPAGLNLNTGTGAITGIPTATGGPTNVRLTGSNAFGTSAQFTLAITITLGPPVITSPLTASGGATIAFNYQITASNPPHTAFDATPLPAALTVDPATGAISGVPAPGTGGTYNVTISATNATNTGSATLVLTISENPPVITSPLTASGTTGSPFSYTITANNGTTSFNATGLPPGLAVNTASGVISGTPTNPGTFNVSITATNGSGSDTETLVITIALGPPVITSPTTAPNGAVGVAYSGYTITATSLPTIFGASNLPPGLTVNPTTGAITGTPTSAAGSPYTATVTASNGVPPDASQNVTFNVVPAINSAATASGQTTVPFSYQITSAPGPAFTSYAALDPLPAGLTLNTGTGAITGTPTVIGGPTNVRLTGSNAFGTSAQFTLAITIAVGPPVITSAANAGGSEGFAFSYQITATNSPTSFGATGLPPGLSVNTTTGVISGTPTVSGTFNATISAMNATATATQPLAITLGIGIPVFTSAASASGGTGLSFAHQLTATNNPTSFGATGLPTGLSINPATGLITGTPFGAGAFSVNASATNATGTGSQALTINITLRPPTVPGTGVAVTGVAGVPFSYAIQPTGSVTSFTATGLPPGLTLDGATGIITGTPTAGGTYQVTIGVTNSVGTTTFTLTIVIGFQLPTVAAATVDVPYETATPITLPVTGEMVTIAIVTLPEHGLVNVAGGVATYTPAIGYTGPDAFSYTATNPAGTTTAATVSITVIPLPPSARAALMTVPLNSATTFSLAPFIKGAGLTGVAIRTQPSRGTVTVNGLEVTYTPRTDFFGADAFTYVAFGALGSSEPATVSVEVVGRPDPSRDPAVTALIEAQNQAARRFAGTQIGNIHRRMESLHRTEPAEPAPAAPAAPVAAAERIRVASAAGAQPQPVRDVAPLSLVTTIAQAVTSRTLDLNGGTGRADRGTSFWIAGNAWFGNLDATGERAGSTFGTDGVSFGADRRFGDRLSAGLAAGFARDEVKIGTAGSRSKARGASISGYGSYQVGQQTYIDALLGFGTLRFDSDRYVVAVEEFARAERKGRQVFGSIAGAYEHRVGNLLVSPYGRFDFSADRLDAAVESGAGAYALRYAEQDQRASQAALGVRAESRHETEFGFAQPRARAEYRREFGGTRRAIVSYADLLGGDEYSIAPTGTSRNSLMLGVGADLIFRGGLKVGIDYTAQRASGASNTQGIRLMITQDLDARGASPWRFEPLLYKYPINVDFGYGYDDNVNRGRDPAEKRWDNVFSMSANVSRAWPIGKNMRLQVTGLASGEKFDRHAGLGRFSAGAQAEVQYRTSGAFDATTLALSGRALYEQYESNYRTGPRYFLGFNARRALTDRIELFAELGANVRHGNSEVFNWRDYAAKLNIDYSLGRKGILYLSGEYRRGDTASSGFASLVNVGATDVFVPDDAFEGLDYFAYRFDARTVIGTIGINHPLGARDSIDLSWRRVESTPRKRPAWDSPGALRYIDNQYSLVYLMRF